MISRTQRYSGVAVTLHWLIALLIVLNFAAAWVSEGMARAERMQVMANHKAIGITVLFLSVLRIVWRVTHRPPPLQRSLHPWERALAHGVHTLFYLLIIGLPLTGWAMSSSRGPVSIFGLFAMPPLPVPSDKAAGAILHGAHENLAWVMLGLFVLHVAGALKHQFLDRDGTLARMIPFLRATR